MNRRTAKEFLHVRDWLQRRVRSSRADATTPLASSPCSSTRTRNRSHGLLRPTRNTQALGRTLAKGST